MVSEDGVEGEEETVVVGVSEVLAAAASGEAARQGVGEKSREQGIGNRSLVGL